MGKLSIYRVLADDFIALARELKIGVDSLQAFLILFRLELLRFKQFEEKQREAARLEAKRQAQIEREKQEQERTRELEQKRAKEMELLRLKEIEKKQREAARVEAEKQAQIERAKKIDKLNAEIKHAIIALENLDETQNVVNNFYMRNQEFAISVFCDQQYDFNICKENGNIIIRSSQVDQAREFLSELKFLAQMLCEINDECSNNDAVIYASFSLYKKCFQNAAIEHARSVLHEIDFSNDAESIVYSVFDLGYGSVDAKLMYGLFQYLRQNKQECFSESEEIARNEFELLVQAQSEKYRETQKYMKFKSSLLSNNGQEQNNLSIGDMDMMTGIEFEECISKLLRGMGYSTEMTKATGDQGIDLIAQREGIRIGIQAKRYSSTVGYSAIQEVVAGLNYYGLSKGMVVTNSYFSKSARELALKNHIQLWDRKALKEKLLESKL